LSTLMCCLRPVALAQCKTHFARKETHMAHILVVDDVDVVRIAIQMVLERAGHTVDLAADGAEALIVVAGRTPDAVITDLWMPNLDGFHLIRILRSQFPTVAVVALSGGSRRYNQESSLDQARASGATQLLMKPVSKQDLLDAVGESMQAQLAALNATASCLVTASLKL
jgi:CheY-like chemotaxis protein